MVEATVEFNYDAEQPDELSIKVGDVIKNVVMSAGGWWEGELNGKKGMFPDNFVKVIKKDDRDSKRDDGKKDEFKKKDVQAAKRQSVKDLANILRHQVQEGPPALRKKVSEPGNKKKHCKVAFTYEPVSDDELKLEIGEILEITKQEEEGWWEGILNGKLGMFPSNFVEIIEEGTTDSVESGDRTSESTDEYLIKGKKVQGVGLGNIFGDGPIKLRSTGNKKSGEKPSEPPKAEKRENSGLKKQKEAKPVERAIVRYSYAAENEDELNLNEGEIITILDKELEDSGWWKGEVNGKVGVFPDNFIELIKEDPKPKKPPLPTQPPAKVAPKLPEKAPFVEAAKTEPAKEEKPAAIQPAQVVLPNKKPSHPPPPLTKKPTKPADDKEEPSAVSFDVVEPHPERLIHPTANRAKGPSKRPPSQVFTQNEEEGNGDAKDLHWVSEEKLNTGQPVSSRKSDEVPGKLPARPVDTPASSAHLQSAINDLRKELKDVKDHYVTKTTFNELKSENDRLKQDLENVKSSYSRRLNSMLTELDEEKKIRLAVQVEMERIRKIVAESHV